MLQSMGLQSQTQLSDWTTTTPHTRNTAHLIFTWKLSVGLVPPLSSSHAPRHDPNNVNGESLSDLGIYIPQFSYSRTPKISQRSEFSKLRATNTWKLLLWWKLLRKQKAVVVSVSTFLLAVTNNSHVSLLDKLRSGVQCGIVESLWVRSGGHSVTRENFSSDYVFFFTIFILNCIHVWLHWHVLRIWVMTACTGTGKTWDTGWGWSITHLLLPTRRKETYPRATASPDQAQRTSLSG